MLDTDATLNTVLTTTGGTYKGPGTGPYGLNPFNATGAAYTQWSAGNPGSTAEDWLHELNCA